MSTTYPSNLSDAEWEYAHRHLPPMASSGGSRTQLRCPIDTTCSFVTQFGAACGYVLAPAWGNMGKSGTWHVVRCPRPYSQAASDDLEGEGQAERHGSDR